MSSNTPTSFASAAAGQSRGSRPGDGDWSRREGRSANGTLTFRRPSAIANQQPQSPADAALSPALPALAESPSARPSLPPFDGSMRYSRSDLLGIYRVSSAASRDVSSLFVNGWNPAQANGAQRGWGKTSEGTVPQDPTVCWDANGAVGPLGVQEMTDEEKELFLDVNSTLKPQQPKDNGQGGAGNGGASSGANGRKTSISHGIGSSSNNSSNTTSSNIVNTSSSGAGNSSNSNNAASSIASARPSTRRRDAPDTTAFTAAVTSPLAGRSAREESWFGRKAADPKEPLHPAQQPDEPDDGPGASSARPSALGTLNRTAVGGVLGAGSSALWGASANQAPPPTAGAFGSFALPTAVSDKRFGSVRGESRLAHLLPKQDNADPPASATKAGGPAAGLAAKDSWRPRQRTDTDPFGDDAGPAGPSGPPAFDTPVKNQRGDFGMAGLSLGSALDADVGGSPETNPFRSPPAERLGSGGLDDDPLAHAAHPSGGTAGSSGGPDHAAAFGSTRGGFPTAAFDGSDRSQTSSVGAKGFPSLGNIAGWGQPLTASTPDRDRAVFSGVFGNALFSPGAAGDLQSPGFASMVPGGNVFGAPTAGATGSIRSTTSKLNALFPPSMQAQMAAGAQESSGGGGSGGGGGLSDSISDLRQINPLGAIGREAIGSQARDADGSRPGRGLFDDPTDPGRVGGPASLYTTEQASQPNLMASAPPALPLPFDVSGRPSAETPPNAARTMVMPDRMRWVYLDPQGLTQGPFTGLEMNDWYKANFFTPDLRVRKVEDTEFEPLGQLIRRIGNSREPFLVPQMGIPHGQPSLSGTFVHGNHGGVVPPLVGAFPSYGRTLTAEEQNNLERRKQEEQYLLARQREMLAVQHHPPFAPGGRPGAVGVPSSALHHHSSAHSLHSQPSFGSMTSPIATGPPPMPGHLGAGTQGFFEHAALPPAGQAHVNPSTEFLRDEYSLQERQMLAGLQQPPLGAVGNFALPPPSGAGHGADLGHLPTADQLQKDPQGFSERLKEFKKLREHMDEQGLGFYEPESSAAGASAGSSHQQAKAADAVDEVATERQHHHHGAGQPAPGTDGPLSASAQLSLTQQVQKTQEAAAAKRRGAQHREAAEAARPDLPTPFPPPPGSVSGLPLAAPTAQRTRSTLPDQYAVSGSRSETPEGGASSSATQQQPALAPWAREPGAESHRGPSLKEIQEAEAKKAAKDEEIAAAARRVAAEQEAALQRERDKAAAALAPGLPTSSTWANGTPVAGVTVTAAAATAATAATTTAAAATAPAAPSGSPWSKTGTARPSASGPAAGSAAHSAADKKKTLAEIQREEEANKQRREVSQSPSALSHGVGKRYADLAGRGGGGAHGGHGGHGSAAPSPVAAGTAPAGVASGWATVGAGGKVKSPTVPAAGRTISSALPAAKPAAAATAAASMRSGSRHVSGVSGKADSSAAMEEFNKWVHREVSRGVADDIDVNVFVDSLRQLPLEAMIIADAVYGHSKTMDGRHFAEEFIRRKRLAEKGVVESQAPAAAAEHKGGSGWNEVAKKGSGHHGGHQKEESMPAGFKVVPSRRKGKK